MPTKKPSRVSVAAHESPLLVPRKAEPNLFDIRATSGKDHIIRRRPWKHVTGICLHQTACRMGESPSRFKNSGAHIFITRSGKVVWVHDFTFAVVHGNRWNSRTVGIEIDGTYAGIEGDLKTFWKPKEQPNRKPQKLTEAAELQAHETIRWICQTVAENSGEIKVLVAHRQASKSRRSDPGSAIWQRVALPMHKELGLSDGGEGFCTRRAADPRGVEPRLRRRQLLTGESGLGTLPAR